MNELSGQIYRVASITRCRRLFMLSNVQFSCFVLSYLVALGCEGFALARKSGVAKILTLVMTLAGFVAQTAFLIIESRAADLPPLLSSTRDWFLVLAWLGVLFYLIVTALDRKLPLGLFLLPPVLILIGAAALASDDANSLIADEATHRWGMLHAGSLVIGTASVLIGFVASLMYLLQHRRLRSKRGGSNLLLPNLEKLALVNWWSVVVAVPLLTIGLVAGVILVQLDKNTESTLSFADPTVIAHGVVWIVMVALFYRLLRRRGPAGKKVAWLTVGAFGFLIATMVGLQLLVGSGRLDSFHSPPASAKASTEGESA